MKRMFFLALCLIATLYADAQSNELYSRTSIKCMGTELDGSQTLRVLGYGRNKNDAKEQAMKNAVYAVVFTVIHEGVAGCNLRPLVTEVNARERYEEYFNIFFTDHGEYNKYVTLQDTKRRSADKSKDKLGYLYEMTVRVLRSELKARFKQDNVISPDHL